MTLAVRRADGLLLATRLGFGLIAFVSLVLYGIYFEAFLRYASSPGSINGLSALTPALAVPVATAIELILASAFWGASGYLVVRRPDSIMALMCAAVGFMMPVRVAFIQVIPIQMLPAWFPHELQTVFLAVFATLAYVVFALFPDGQMRPGWVRWWVYARIPIMINYVTNIFPPLNAIYLYVDIVMFVALMVAQYQRFRLSRISIERQQTKWTLLGMAFGLGFFFIRRLADIYLVDTFNELYIVVYMVSRLAVISIPISITFALLRYRLYDVDWVLNRGLVYGGLTAMVVGVFGVGLVISQVLLALFVSASDARVLMAVLSAILLASLYQPVQRWLQEVVDRRFFRLRTTPEEMIARQKSAPITDQQWSGVKLDALTIGDLVGKGSMGRVYEATYREERVAVKMLSREHLADEDFRAMVQREMRLFQDLNHPNICQMLGSGMYQGAPYIIMEFIEGDELEKVLEYRGVLTLEQARLITRDIAAALDYIHERNIIHRDIKPRNIIVQDTRAVLTDFGTARHIVGTQGTASNLLTTPDYTAPEQLSDSGEVYTATDVYSLGVVVYRMLTGQKPFEGSLRQKMLAIVHQPPRDPRELNPMISEDTAATVLKALHKVPQMRFQSAGEFARNL